MHKQPLTRWWLLAAGIIVIDQITKWLVLLNTAPYTAYPIMPHLNLVHVYNKGAAWSFLAQHEVLARWLFSSLAVAASIFIVYLMKKEAHTTRMRLGLTLILAGAIGNLIDRVLLGHVVDFIDFYWGTWHFPAFNVADIAITLGAFTLIWDSFVTGNKPTDAPQ